MIEQQKCAVDNIIQFYEQLNFWSIIYLHIYLYIYTNMVVDSAILIK